jgi:hypothetical protein
LIVGLCSWSIEAHEMLTQLENTGRAPRTASRGMVAASAGSRVANASQAVIPGRTTKARDPRRRDALNQLDFTAPGNEPHPIGLHLAPTKPFSSRLHTRPSK